MCYYAAMQKKRLLTGLQSSGTLHIGNYFGAILPFLQTYQEYESILMVADYHALTTVRDGDTLRENIVNSVKDYLAAGLDTQDAILFQQSQVQEHTELAWILENLVTVPFLQLSHAYKDKVAKGIEPTAGLFNYPMLMAADILLYDSEVVPVGKDQQQHIEYAREAANKFNNAYGQTFVLPEAKINEAVAVIPGTDGNKMSKSYKNTIPLFGTRDEIAKAVMSIVTDSSGERPENVYKIHSLFKTTDELDALYTENAGKYKKLKEALIEDIEAVISPMRTKRDSITDADVVAVLQDGSNRARAIACAKMSQVRKKVGVSLQ